MALPVPMHGPEQPPRGDPDAAAAGQTRVAIASPDSALRLQLRRLLPPGGSCRIVGSTRLGVGLRAALADYEPDALIIDGRADREGAEEALALVRGRGGRSVLLHVAGAAPLAGQASVALACPADLALEAGDGGFARELAAAVRVPAPRRARAPQALHPLRPPPEVIAFGSSTGGPPALLEVFRVLRRAVPVPMLLTQHMPPRFTAMLAQQITHAGTPTHEAEQGMPLQPGHLYVAPGGQHLTLQRRDRSLICALDDGEPENFCKPSVDVMMRSVTRTCRGRGLAVILTGMGNDGLLGCRELVEAGGTVIAQDEATSVVWGMPGAVATAGLCKAVLPIGEIAGAVGQLLSR